MDLVKQVRELSEQAARVRSMEQALIVNDRVVDGYRRYVIDLFMHRLEDGARPQPGDYATVTEEYLAFAREHKPVGVRVDWPCLEDNSMHLRFLFSDASELDVSGYNDALAPVYVDADFGIAGEYVRLQDMGECTDLELVLGGIMWFVPTLADFIMAVGLGQIDDAYLMPEASCLKVAA